MRLAAATLVAFLAVLALPVGCGSIAFRAVAWDAALPRSDAGVPPDASAASAFDAGAPDAAVPDGAVVEWTIVVAADIDDGELDETQSYGVAGYAPQGEHDCEVYSGGYSKATHPGNGHTIAFWRFAMPGAVPPGSRVIAADLSLHGDGDWVWDPSRFALTVLAERSADAPAVASIADDPLRAGGRSLVSATVRWPATGGLAWVAGAWNQSPDLSAPLQEVVDSAGGLSAGAHLQLFTWREDTFDADGEVTARDSCGADGNAPRLHLRFETP